MSIPSFSQKGLLIIAVVMSMGGFGAVWAAQPGSAVEVSPPPPVPPVAPIPKPAPSMPAQVIPAVTPAPVAATVSTEGVASNPDGSCPSSAPVKVSKAKIYHVPEERNYAKTKARHCFASAEAAKQAGYRAPKK